MSRWPTGKFHVDVNAPEPYGICDRCSAMHALSALSKQQEWRGRNLVTRNGLLICERCLDVPNEQNRTIKLPPDPVPVRDPRPIPPYASASDEWDEDGGTYDDDITEFEE